MKAACSKTAMEAIKEIKKYEKNTDEKNKKIQIKNSLGGKKMKRKKILKELKKMCKILKEKKRKNVVEVHTGMFTLLYKLFHSEWRKCSRIRLLSPY